LSRSGDELDQYDWEGALRFVRALRPKFRQIESRLARTPLPHLDLPPEDYIGFVPSPMSVVHRMLELAEIQPGDMVYDLGCGDGRVLICAARKYGARGVGIEIDRDRIEDARRRASEFEDRITFRRQNVFKVDLRPADVVTLYLLPKLNERLLPRLRNLKRGARIVSHRFELPGVVAHKVARRKDSEGFQHEIFAYRTPLVGR
jgi:SAM-dependent methyltransferase